MSSLQLLRDQALTDEVLRLALAGASEAADVQSIAQQCGIPLSAAEAQQWLAADTSPTAALSPEELNTLSEGLSLSDEDLDAMAAGAYPGGEAII